MSEDSTTHSSTGRFLVALVAGPVAGVVAFLLDQLLALVTLGDVVPVTGDLALLYPAFGLVAGVVVALVALGPAWPGRPDRFVDACGLALAILYAAAVFERVHGATKVALPAAAALGAALVVVVAYGVFGVVLSRLADDASIGAPLVAGLAALGLSINRNWLDHPLAPEALALDAAVLLLGLGVAWIVRARGRRLGLAALAAGLVAALVVSVGPRLVSGDRVPAETAAGASTRGEPPNLVLLVIDTLRADVLRSVLEETPEGRAFTERFDDAAFFDDAVAAAPWTAPSMGSILTGLYPSEHGFGTKAEVQDPNRPLRRLSGRVPTLAGRLANRGYHTEAIVTNALLHPASGIHRGFEHYELLGGPKAKLPLLTVAMRLGLIESGSYQPAAEVDRHLARRLDVLARAEPFFLWLHFMDPHEPLQAHDLPPDPSAPTLEGDEKLYRDEVRYLLGEMAEIVDRLDAAGLWESSAVVLVADHGEMFPSDGHDNGVLSTRTGEPKLQGHGHALYDELVRVPLAIRPPGGLPAPRRIDALVSHVDLHDTVVDLLGVDVPKIGRDRRSLAPFLAPGYDETTGRDWALAGANQDGPRQRALRRGPWKLITYQGRPLAELYDLANDPDELRDLGRERPEQVRAKETLLAERWAELGEVRDNEDMRIDDETRKNLEALGYVQ